MTIAETSSEPPAAQPVREEEEQSFPLLRAIALDYLVRPDGDVLAGRQVEQRLPLQLDPERSRHRVLDDLGLGAAQLPRPVVDLGPQDSSLVVQRVGAVALGFQSRLSGAALYELPRGP